MISEEQINELDSSIKESINATMIKIPKDSNMIRIILAGITGSGKSTLSCILSEILLMIGRIGKKIVIQGPGIDSGGTSVTREPSFTLDEKTNMVYIDCPGFDDTERAQREIINAFVMDSLFENQTGQELKFKILLVASDSEFEAARAQEMSKNFELLEMMFPNQNQLKQGIGLIITKSKKEWEGIDYIESLEKNSSPIVKKWCTFFRGHLDHIFVVPKPSKKNVGKQYIYEDRNELIQFLKTDCVVNPEHKIGLNENCLLILKNLRMCHQQKIAQTVNEICVKIGEKFRKEEKSEAISHWINIIDEIMRNYIKTAKDFIDIICKYIPNCDEYENEFIQLAESEKLDSFIDKVLYSDIETSCINEIVKQWGNCAIRELQKTKYHALLSENQKQLISQHEAALRQYESTIRQMESSNKRYIESLEKSNEEKYKLIQENAFQKANNKNQQETIDLLQKHLSDTQENMNNLRNEVLKMAKSQEKDGICLLI